MRIKIRSFSFMIFLGVWVLPAVTGCSKAPAITKAERTSISPHLEAQIDSTNNILYCASFQIAWDKMCTQVIKEDIRLQGNPLTAQRLNRQSLSNSDISRSSYVAEAGAYSKELVEKINGELQEKFGDQGGDFKMPQTTAGDRSIIAYAYLFKNLEFPTKFEKLTTPVSFQANGSSTPVVAFGIESYSHVDHKDLSDQIAIFDYRSDNDFILSLTSKSDDEIILAMIKPGKTLLDTFQTVAKRMVAGKRTNIWDNDKLKIPKIDFKLSTSFPELEGKPLLNSGWDEWVIASAIQDTRFKLDEKGAMLRSIGFLNAKKEEVPMGDRRFIFDKPFLICLKQKTGRYPYFALWVNNPELMIRP